MRYEQLVQMGTMYTYLSSECYALPAQAVVCFQYGLQEFRYTIFCGIINWASDIFRSKVVEVQFLCGCGVLLQCIGQR